jgi:UDP-glucose 4-epimerase
MKIAVTGGSGQLGTLVLRKLAADRKVTAIRSLDLRPPIVASRKVEARTVDVRDPDFGRHLEGCDALVHLAFIVVPWAPRPIMDAVNVEGSKNVFVAAAAANIKSIVYASSVAAYGVVAGHPTPIVEDTPRRDQPAFAYAANKFAVEAFLDSFEAEHPDIAIARLRPTILIGARIEHMLGKAFEAGIFPDPGGPILPYVWDDDVAAAVVLCLQKRARGAYNLVADGGHEAAELARAAGLRHVRIPPYARQAYGQLLSLFVKLGGTPPGDPSWVTLEPPTLTYSSDKARRELGWAPKYPTSIDVFRRAGEVIRGRVDPRIGLFFRFAGAFAKRMPAREDHVKTTVHIELTGPGGADYALHFDSGRLSIEPGVPRPPKSVVSLRAAVFRDLLAGRLTPATAEITGKFRVEGEPLGAMALSGLVAMFRSQLERPGAKGWPAQKFAAWLERP